MSQQATLNHRRARLSKLFEEASKHTSVDEIHQLITKIKDTTDQICGRAEVAEVRVQELEEWSPLTIHIECPNCNTKTQASIPGSDWYKQELDKFRNG